MKAIIACDGYVEAQPSVVKRRAKVCHIIAGLEKRAGGRPVLPVDREGGVTIPGQYLALMGLAGGGELRFVPCLGGVMIERADPAGVVDRRR